MSAPCCDAPWRPSNMAAGIFPVPSLTPTRAPTALSHGSCPSSVSSPRMPRRDCALELPHLLPPPSRASTASSSSRSRRPNLDRTEDYLKSMQRVGHAHQQQLQILEKHWDLLQDFEKGKLDVFRKEHELLRQKQRHLLHEVELQLHQLSQLPPELTFHDARPRVLLLGDGLLSRQLRHQQRWHLRGVSGEALEAELRQFQPQVVLHLGDQLAAPSVARCCARHKVFLLHLSSDEVFDGRAPPYTVNAEPSPVTEAGVASLRAEQAVLGTGAAVLRVPRWVYGAAELGESPVTGILEELRRGKVDFDIQPVYPTYAGDVASVVHLLVEHLLKGGELRGIYHFQGPDQLSELQIAKLWCQATGSAASAAALRPRASSEPLVDRALDISRLTRSFPVVSTTFKEGIKKCLPPGQITERLGKAGTLQFADGCKLGSEQVV